MLVGSISTTEVVGTALVGSISTFELNGTALVGSISTLSGIVLVGSNSVVDTALVD